MTATYRSAAPISVSYTHLFADASVCEINPIRQTLAKTRGFDTFDPQKLEKYLPQAELIFNTVPAPILTDPLLIKQDVYKRQEWKKMPAVPVNGSGCTGCGLCAGLCPSGAISKENPSVTDPEKCILCLRCIAVCPSGAKKLPERVQEMLNQKLLPLKGIRKENELFL